MERDTAASAATTITATATCIMAGGPPYTLTPRPHLSPEFLKPMHNNVQILLLPVLV